MEVKNVKYEKIEYPTSNKLSNGKPRKIIKASLLTTLIGLISTKSFAARTEIIPGNMPTNITKTPQIEELINVPKTIGRRIINCFYYCFYGWNYKVDIF